MELKPLDEIDRQVIKATQEGLPLVPQPYQVIGEQIGLTAKEVMDRLKSLLDRGAIRRVGVVPNHYRLGYVANGMTVWDVDDSVVDEMGARVGSLDAVSHCYHRPRFAPDWPYNFFAMVHGRTREEVERHTRHIAECLGSHARSHTILYSTRILKKTGLRLSQ